MMRVDAISDGSRWVVRRKRSGSWVMGKVQRRRGGLRPAHKMHFLLPFHHIRVGFMALACSTLPNTGTVACMNARRSPQGRTQYESTHCTRHTSSSVAHWACAPQMPIGPSGAPRTHGGQDVSRNACECREAKPKRCNLCVTAANGTKRSTKG